MDNEKTFIRVCMIDVGGWASASEYDKFTTASGLGMFRLFYWFIVHCILEIINAKRIMEYDPFKIARDRNRILFCRRYPGAQDCPICLTQMQDKPVTVYPCGHCIHLSCDKRLRNSRCATKDKCVICRQFLPRNSKDRFAMTLELEDVDVLVDILLTYYVNRHEENVFS